MSKLPNELLKHIAKEIEYLINTSSGIDEMHFMRNETIQRAFERSIEIIGEAVKNLPAEFKQKHNEIDWSAIAKMRDRLIHHYYGTDYAVVWDVVAQEIPRLQVQVEKILNERPNS